MKYMVPSLLFKLIALPNTSDHLLAGHGDGCSIKQNHKFFTTNTGDRIRLPNTSLHPPSHLDPFRYTQPIWHNSMFV